MKKKCLHVHFLVCPKQGLLSTDGVGVERGTVFQEIRPCACFKTDDFVEGKLGGGGCRRTTRWCGKTASPKTRL